MQGPCMSELVSIIIPVFNGEKYIAETIQSVLTQSYPNIEIIAVDDGSTDNTKHIICDQFEMVNYHYQNNQGQGAALNHGLSLAKGEFITFLDADDLIMPDKTKTQVNYLKSMPEIDMVYGIVEQFVCPSLTVRQQIAHAGTALNSATLAGATLSRKNCFERVGRLDPQWIIGGYMDWYLRAKEVGLQEYYLPELALRRRIHDNNQSITARDSRGQYLQILKASLERKKAATIA